MKLVLLGFEEIREQIKQKYRTKNNAGDFIYTFPNDATEKQDLRKVERSLSRILSGIQVSWAEESIKRLLYETGLFDDMQRNYLLQRPALDQRWYTALHIIFCIAYNLVPPFDKVCKTVDINLERRNLGNDLVDHYFELKSIITNYLVPSFAIRNKVQHGEWEYAFKSTDSMEFSPEMTEKLKRENIITTTSRFTLVKTFYHMIVDMGRFKSNSFAIDSMLTPFEYFFKHNIRKIRFETEKIANSRLEDFVVDLLQKEVRGASHREKRKII